MQQTQLNRSALPARTRGPVRHSKLSTTKSQQRGLEGWSPLMAGIRWPAWWSHAFICWPRHCVCVCRFQCDTRAWIAPKPPPAYSNGFTHPHVLTQGFTKSSLQMKGFQPHLHAHTHTHSYAPTHSKTLTRMHARTHALDARARTHHITRRVLERHLYRRCTCVLREPSHRRTAARQRCRMSDSGASLPVW